MSNTSLNISQKFDIAALLTASVVFFISNRWNILIQHTINYYFPDTDNSLTAELIYTLSLTLLSVIILNYVLKIYKPIQTQLNNYLS